MLTALKIAMAFVGMIAAGFGLAWLSASAREEARPALQRALSRLEGAAHWAWERAGEPSAVETEDAPAPPPTPAEPTASAAASAEPAGLALAERFLDEASLSSERAAIREGFADAAMATLEGLFVEGIAREWEDRRALELAGAALREVAERDPLAALSLLRALGPMERERLAPAVARGWASDDLVEAWEWIETAWAEAGGGYIDRSLQREMHLQALDAALTQSGDFATAVALYGRTPDPQLKAEIATLVARRLVSDNPAYAWERLDFETVEGVDAAIMDAVALEWSRRDAPGAAQWALANRDQLSGTAIRWIAKGLSLSGLEGGLRQLREGLGRGGGDLVAAEAARLAARRRPEEAGGWLRTIGSSSVWSSATLEALEEVGYEDFERTLRLVNAAEPPGSPRRLEALFFALQLWSEVDPEQARAFAASDKVGLAPGPRRQLEQALSLLPAGEAPR